MVKNLPAIWETQVQPLDGEDPLEEEMATHPNILAWRIPWIEERGYSPRGHRESDMTACPTLRVCVYTCVCVCVCILCSLSATPYLLYQFIC